jgi:hypothetical protein
VELDFLVVENPILLISSINNTNTSRSDRYPPVMYAIVVYRKVTGYRTALQIMTGNMIIGLVSKGPLVFRVVCSRPSIIPIAGH